jgi:TRAP-type C4-dicarboxylate transport system substrate-binding protein
LARTSSKSWKIRCGALAWGENGYRDQQLQVDQTPADMKGEIRVVGSPLFLDTFTALGANPTELCRRATALATGAVDGQENDVDLHRRWLHNSAQNTSRCGATSTTR